MKKVLSIILCLVMVLGIFTAVPFSASAEDTDETESSETVAESPDDKDLAVSAEPDDLAEVGADLDVCESGAIDQSTWNSRINSLKSAYPNFSVWNGAPFNGGYSCEGWTRYVGYTVFGSHTTTWSISYSLDGVKAGDVIRYDYGSSQTDYGHSIFVTGVSGNTIYYVDCNGIGNYNQNTNPWTYVRSNGVYWDQSIQKNDAIIGMNGKTNFLYRRVSPGVGDHTHNYNTFAYYGSAHPHYAYYKCSCGEVKADTNSPSYSSTCSDCNHTVSYDANGGTGAPASQTKKYLSTLYLSDDEPTRPNHEFLGWSRDKNAKEPEYGPGARYTSDTSVTLYAVWEFLGYTIKFDADGATNVPYEKTVQDGENYTVSSVIPSKLGYIFMGWTLSKNSEVYYQSGDTISSYNLAASANSNYVVTLYAKWKAPTVIEVSKVNNYTLLSAPSGEYTYSIKYFVFTPTESGSYFIQWNKNSDNQSIHYYANNEWHYLNSELKALVYLEGNKPCYFVGYNHNKSNVSGSITLTPCDIVSAKIESNQPVIQDYTGYYSYESFKPVITLYDKNNHIIFKGSKQEYEQQYGVSPYAEEKWIDSPGDYTYTVLLTYGSNISADMTATVLGDEKDKVIGLKASIKEDIPLVIGCEHCTGYLSTYNLGQVVLTIQYQNGTSVTVDVGENGSKYKGQYISTRLENENPVVGKNNVILSYGGVTTTYQVTCVESPVEKLSVITAPSITEEEWRSCTSQSPGEEIVKAHNIKIKVSYKDKTSKNMVIDSLTWHQYKLGDSIHPVKVATYGGEWAPNRDNRITVSYLGASVDVYVDITESDIDELVDFELLSMPDGFDMNHYTGYPDIMGAKFKATLESGKQVVAEIIRTDLSMAYINVNGIVYRLSLNTKPEENKGLYVRCNDIEKLIFPYSSNKIVSIQVVGEVNTTKLQNSLLRIEYSDGKVVYTKADDYKRYTGHLRLDSGFYLNYSAQQGNDLYYSYSHGDVPIEFNNSSQSKAKAVAYNIGKNGNIANGYRMSNRSSSDVESLIETTHFFFGKMEYARFTMGIPDSTLPFDEAYRYLNQYYGLSKNEIYQSKYYNERYDALVIKPESAVYLGYDESIQLYSETADSYIFKYSDENKTQYIEVSKELKLLSVSGTAPSAAKQYNITMKGGYSSQDSAFVGNTVTVCVNVPDGKEFVKWTSNNSSVKFANATSTSTTFCMVGANVEITPVFKDAAGASYKLGDTDGDGVVSVLDATTIQKVRASIAVNSFNEDAADVDGDKVVSVLDATFIQKHLAHIPVPYEIGKTIG